MNFEELGKSWREQNDNSNESDSVEVLAKVVRRAERGRISNMFWGAVGVVASLSVLCDFGNTIVNDPSSLDRIGAALVVVGALGVLASIAYSFWPSRIGGQSICDYFSRELQRIDKVIASNKSPYLYLLLSLVTVGVCLTVFDDLPTPRAILVIVGAAAIFMVTWLSARGIVSRAEALRKDMEQVLSDLRQDPA